MAIVPIVVSQDILRDIATAPEGFSEERGNKNDRKESCRVPFEDEKLPSQEDRWWASDDDSDLETA